MNAIPFLSLDFQHDAIREQLQSAFSDSLTKGQFVLGEGLSVFEEEFAAFLGITYCVGVGSGLDALVVALKALGISKGDEVIVPSHTCFATWLAVSNVGAKPVPVEIDERNYTINPTLISAAITSRTKAIIPVHLYGHPCKMTRIIELAQAHGLFVVEDNAQAHGATWAEQKTGSWGEINATSFYPTKNLGALGDGGAVSTNRKDLYEFCQAFRNYGSAKKDVHPQLGINSRLDEWQAAVLSIKLKQLDNWNDQRRRNAKQYSELLFGVGDLILPPQSDDEADPVFHQFVIRTSKRNQLQTFLHDKGIGTAIHYPKPVHLQDAYATLGFKKGNLPIAERVSESILSLPIWPGLQTDQIERVAIAIRQFFGHHL